MKRIIIIVGCLIALTYVCFAEDVVVEKDSCITNTEATEVNVENFKYKDFQRTTQLRPYKNEGQRFLNEAPPLLLQQYQDGKQMVGVGLLLTITGGSTIVMTSAVAFVLTVFSFGFYDIPTNTVVALYAVGGVCLSIGIPLLAIGGAKKRNAFNTFRKEYPATKTISNFQLNLHSNGLGFAYVF